MSIPTSSRSAFLRPSLLVLALVLALLPLAMPNNYVADVAVRIALAAIAAIGLNLLMGFAGQISIGHAAFVAIGAYGSGIVTVRFGWPPLAAIGGAAIGAAVVAWLIAKPILRLKGHSLTMATLGLGVIVNIVLINEVDWTGGPDGMPVPPLVVAGFAFVKVMHWYALAAVLLWLSVLLSLNLYESPAGRALRGLNGSEVAARVMGVDVARFKVRAFVASAVFAAGVGQPHGALPRLHQPVARGFHPFGGIGDHGGAGRHGLDLWRGAGRGAAHGTTAVAGRPPRLRDGVLRPGADAHHDVPAQGPGALHCAAPAQEGLTCSK
jgi:branched-chain amino acid transport system permease protein